MMKIEGLHRLLSTVSASDRLSAALDVTEVLACCSPWGRKELDTT